jgi:hypothetical protein
MRVATEVPQQLLAHVRRERGRAGLDGLDGRAGLDGLDGLDGLHCAVDRRKKK